MPLGQALFSIYGENLNSYLDGHCKPKNQCSTIKNL